MWEGGGWDVGEGEGYVFEDDEKGKNESESDEDYLTLTHIVHLSIGGKY